MNDIKNADYYFGQAERCLRWARLQNDRHQIAELEKLAQDYFDTARRLRSMERAALFKEHALTD